jgi:hypothetical protein
LNIKLYEIMKLIIILFLLPISAINAQLKADAGKDLYLCSDLLAPINSNRGNKLLGGGAAATGGIAPYKYTWTSSYKKAIDFLNDTTSPNPTVNKGFNQDIDIYFYLTVTDSVGTKASDTMQYFKSTCTIIAANAAIYKNEKDTVTLGKPGSKGGKEPYICIYSPNTYLINLPFCESKTYTPSNREYRYDYTDSIGCKCGNKIDIIINTSTIHEIGIESVFSHFENPISTNSILKKNPKFNQELVLKIYAINGELIYNQRLDNELELGKILVKKGIYFTFVYSHDSEIFNFKLFRN